MYWKGLAAAAEGSALQTWLFCPIPPQSRSEALWLECQQVSLLMKCYMSNSSRVCKWASGWAEHWQILMDLLISEGALIRCVLLSMYLLTPAVKNSLLNLYSIICRVRQKTGFIPQNTFWHWSHSWQRVRIWSWFCTECLVFPGLTSRRGAVHNVFFKCCVFITSQKVGESLWSTSKIHPKTR